MRIYGIRDGMSGINENLNNCVVEIKAGKPKAHQCPQKRGKGEGGLYCGFHAYRIKQGIKLNIPNNPAPAKNVTTTTAPVSVTPTPTASVTPANG